MPSFMENHSVLFVVAIVIGTRLSHRSAAVLALIALPPAAFMGVLLLLFSCLGWRSMRKRARSDLTPYALAHPSIPEEAAHGSPLLPCFAPTPTPTPSTLERGPPSRVPLVLHARLPRVHRTRGVTRLVELPNGSTDELCPPYELTYKQPILAPPPPCYSPRRVGSSHPPPYEAGSRRRSALRLWGGGQRVPV
ncbi:hypothetical protein CALCODRAFT_498981 [Calocera cornea HHB12733]|uniref:Uncharacterized protein n=1 Tax=Calocera cornea HHB12733 TaxID=1353952 RepID=A0A165EMH3_9BASI|nr:hypothetical protein CALCODRAFT_498981 [Calocera cornea HHB12733]